MIHDITLDKASLVSLWVESILYGAYAVLFGLCVYVLLNRQTNGTVNKPFLITAIIMFTLNTGHIIVAIIRALKAFAAEDSYSSDLEFDYYAQTWLPADILRQALMVATAFITDVMVAYRCYLIWNCQWKVMIIPAVLLAGATVCASVSVYNFSQLKPGQPFLNSTNINWGYAAFILWLATIILLTSLIVFRLRSFSQQTRELLGNEHGDKYSYIMAVVLESGVIYAASSLILLILCIVRSTYQAIAFDAIAPITGITATLIIVRIGLGTITRGAPTDEFGSNETPLRTRRVSVLTMHDASGSELESMGKDTEV